jgi:hypothetical protein
MNNNIMHLSVPEVYDKFLKDADEYVNYVGRIDTKTTPLDAFSEYILREAKYRIFRGFRSYGTLDNQIKIIIK